MTGKNRIRFSLPIDLLVKVYNTIEEDQSFDERVEHLLRVGMSQEGLLPLPDGYYRFIEQIELKQGGRIRVYEGSKRGFMTYDLWKSDFDLNMKGHSIVSEFFFRAINEKNGVPNLEGIIAPAWHSGSVKGILNDRLKETATELKQILENPSNLEKITRADKRRPKDRIRSLTLEGENLD